MENNEARKKRVRSTMELQRKGKVIMGEEREKEGYNEAAEKRRNRDGIAETKNYVPMRSKYLETNFYDFFLSNMRLTTNEMMRPSIQYEIETTLISIITFIPYILTYSG